MEPQRFYVSPEGNDKWSGRLVTANGYGSDGPFFSLTRARDAIRQLKYREGGMLHPVEVQVRGGTYRMEAPLQLSADDGGTAECPVTWMAFPGEEPVLSGGRSLTNWQPHQGKIIRTQLADVRDGLWWFRQLFYRNSVMTRACWPKCDSQDPLYSGWAFIENIVAAACTEEAPAQPTTFHFEEGALPGRWLKPRQTEIFVIPGRSWISDIIPVREVDHAARTIRLSRPVGSSANTLGMATHLQTGNRFYVENDLSFLTQPGEWCLDTDDGMLYFRPPDDDWQNAEIVAPATARLIEMTGSQHQKLQHVTIRGFTFRHTLTEWPTAESYYKTPNAGQTLYMENTAHCSVEDNFFDAVGGDAIRLQGVNTANRVTGNTIADAGAYGIFVGNLQRGFARHDPVSGDVPNPPAWFADPHDRAATVAAWPRSTDHVISNNHIYRVGRFEKHGQGIAFYGVSAIDCVVSHNLIHDTPRFGIGLMSGFGRVTIEYNDLYNLSQETCDTGGICFNRWYTYESEADLQRGCIIRYNRVRDVLGCGAYGKKMEQGGGSKGDGRIWIPYYSWAIYLDNAPMDVEIYGNITARNTLGGLMISHYGRNVIVENNIFVDSDTSQLYFLFDGQMENIRVSRNIFSYSRPDSDFLRLVMGQGIDLKKVVTQFDNNLYCNSSGREPTFNGLAGEAAERVGIETQDIPDLGDWQKMGFDAHSVNAAPQFVDAAQDNYDLKPESPALKLGFRPDCYKPDWLAEAGLRVSGLEWRANADRFAAGRIGFLSQRNSASARQVRNSS